MVKFLLAATGMLGLFGAIPLGIALILTGTLEDRGVAFFYGLVVFLYGLVALMASDQV